MPTGFLVDVEYIKDGKQVLTNVFDVEGLSDESEVRDYVEHIFDTVVKQNEPQTSPRILRIEKITNMDAQMETRFRKKAILAKLVLQH